MSTSALWSLPTTVLSFSHIPRCVADIFRSVHSNADFHTAYQANTPGWSVPHQIAEFRSQVLISHDPHQHFASL